MTEPELHKALKPLEWLLGTWTGSGSGRYPTIDSFEYREESRFWHNGRPQLFYLQQTWNPSTDVPMHSETGYFRPTPQGLVELVLAHTFGIVEVSEGLLDGHILELSTAHLASTSTAKKVEALTRRYELVDGRLHYLIHMRFGDNELQPHLAAELERVTS